MALVHGSHGLDWCVIGKCAVIPIFVSSDEKRRPTARPGEGK